MIWFKHFSDNHRGRSMQYLMDEMGHLGPASYYFLIEMCVEKLIQKPDRNLEEADCSFQFHQRIVRQTLRISPTNLRRLLCILQEVGLISYEFSGNTLQIKMPILLDLLHYDNKKTGKRRVSVRIENGGDKSIVDKSKEDKSILIPKPVLVPELVREKANTELNRKIWESYRAAYSARYGVEPVRNGSVNAKISQIGKRLGEDAIEIVKFYVAHNDSFFIKSAHAIGLALSNAESLATQWKTGKQITQNEIRRFEKASVFEKMAKDAEVGGF